MTSVFTSRITKEITIPNTDGATATVRKLNPKALEAAAKEQQRQALESVKAIGGMSVVRELRDAAAATPSDAPAETPNPMLGFDRLTLIEKGVVGWSFEEPLTVASFEDLDEETASFLAREVLQLARPDLFLTVEQAEGARKNA